MDLLEAIETPPGSGRKLEYRELSLVDLIRKVVTKSDRLALHEFHNNRKLFRYDGDPPLLFIDYLNALRKSAAKMTWTTPNALELADKAYALTTEKFSNLPRARRARRHKKKNNRKMKQKGVDCRLYFKAFLERVARTFETNPPSGQIAEENRAATDMQGLVQRHFHLSLLEAERSANPFRSRYNWRLRGGTICVWLPVSLKGGDRRRWLERNIDDPDPLRPGEKERIQSIINRKLAGERFVPLGDVGHIPNEEEILPWSKTGKTFGKSLAEAVAREKAIKIRQQRPAIRALGEKKLKQLILRIFRDLTSGKYKDRKVAGHFGLSKATFSRFAGSRWRPKESAIPDLWRNTAEVLSAHPNFKKVAISTGVWQQVKGTLDKGERGNQS